MKFRVGVLILVLACASIAQLRKEPERPARHALRGQRGAVAAGTDFAADAGVRLYYLGGNAVDAGVASMLAASVCEFSHFGIGGEAPILIRSKDGRVHSIAGVGTMPKLISYTRSLARECGPFNITANTVCPGWIDWDGIPRVVAPEVRTRAISEMPLGRVGNDADVAGAVLFLVSDLAAYVTGVSLDVNGGLYMA
jgi:NAD(P)-dependent dehydrogenase (short-subunit alcohol dehydrogenase family)